MEHITYSKPNKFVEFEDKKGAELFITIMDSYEELKENAKWIFKDTIDSADIYIFFKNFIVFDEVIDHDTTSTDSDSDYESFYGY